MIINSVIVEDELPNAKRLEKLLQDSAYAVNVMARLQTVKDAVIWFNNNKADIVFMDIRLTDGLSFEIYKAAPVDCPVVFTTAYDEYALQAFKVNSIDYLLKPIEKPALEQALKKFMGQAVKPDNQSLMQLLHSIHLQQTIYRTRYLVNYRDMLVPIPVNQIAYFCSEFKSTYFVTQNGDKHFIEETMEEVEHELNPACFFRITRQCIVCPQSVYKIHNYFNGRLKIELNPAIKDEIILSRDKSKAFKEWLNK
jgi:two-component system, LytTR family, response regulator LytT